MIYTKIIDHLEDSVSNLIFQFRDGSDIEKLVSSDGQRFQDIENSLFDVYNCQFIDRATGINLDFIGNEIGQPRPLSGDTSDNTYRYLIKAKIAANRSNGTLPEIYNILGLLGATGIIAQDIPHAALQLNIKGDLLVSLAEILKALIGATAPIELEINQYTDTPFGFLEDPESFGFDEGELGDSIST